MEALKALEQRLQQAVGEEVHDNRWRQCPRTPPSGSLGTLGRGGVIEEVREGLLDLLSEATQNIIENLSQEFVNAVRVMRRDFASAFAHAEDRDEVHRKQVIEEIKRSQVPTEAINGCLSTVLEEVSKVKCDFELSPLLEHAGRPPIAPDSPDIRFDRLGDLESSMAQLHEAVRSSEDRIISALGSCREIDVDFSELTDAIRESRTEVDLVPILEAISQIREPSVSKVRRLTQSNEVDLRPVLDAMRTMGEEIVCNLADLGCRWGPAATWHAISDAKHKPIHMVESRQQQALDGSQELQPVSSALMLQTVSSEPARILDGLSLHQEAIMQSANTLPTDALANEQVACRALEVQHKQQTDREGTAEVHAKLVAQEVVELLQPQLAKLAFKTKEWQARDELFAALQAVSEDTKSMKSRVFAWEGSPKASTDTEAILSAIVACCADTARSIAETHASLSNRIDQGASISILEPVSQMIAKGTGIILDSLANSQTACSRHIGEATDFEDLRLALQAIDASQNAMMQNMCSFQQEVAQVADALQGNRDEVIKVVAALHEALSSFINVTNLHGMEGNRTIEERVVVPLQVAIQDLKRHAQQCVMQVTAAVVANRVEVDFSEVSCAIKQCRDVDFTPVLQMIEKSRTTVDILPILQAINELQDKVELVSSSAVEFKQKAISRNMLGVAVSDQSELSQEFASRHLGSPESCTQLVAREFERAIANGFKNILEPRLEILERMIVEYSLAPDVLASLRLLNQHSCDFQSIEDAVESSRQAILQSVSVVHGAVLSHHLSLGQEVAGMKHDIFENVVAAREDFQKKWAETVQRCQVASSSPDFGDIAAQVWLAVEGKHEAMFRIMQDALVSAQSELLEAVVSRHSGTSESCARDAIGMFESAIVQRVQDSLRSQFESLEQMLVERCLDPNILPSSRLLSQDACDVQSITDLVESVRQAILQSVSVVHDTVLSHHSSFAQEVAGIKCDILQHVNAAREESQKKWAEIGQRCQVASSSPDFGDIAVQVSLAVEAKHEAMFRILQHALVSQQRELLEVVASGRSGISEPCARDATGMFESAIVQRVQDSLRPQFESLERMLLERCLDPSIVPSLRLLSQDSCDAPSIPDLVDSARQAILQAVSVAHNSVVSHHSSFGQEVAGLKDEILRSVVAAREDASHRLADLQQRANTQAATVTIASPLLRAVDAKVDDILLAVQQKLCTETVAQDEAKVDSSQSIGAELATIRGLLVELRSEPSVAAGLDLGPVIAAVRQQKSTECLDFSPVIAAIRENKVDVDFSGVFEAIRDMRATVDVTSICGAVAVAVAEVVKPMMQEPGAKGRKQRLGSRSENLHHASPLVCRDVVVHHDRKQTLRFRVGARVECLVGGGEWRLGTVIKHWYSEPTWISGKEAPYGIKLLEPEGCYVYAPQDSDACVRLPHNVGLATLSTAGTVAGSRSSLATSGSRSYRLATA